MALRDDLSEKVAAAREAGRDVPVVIEELLLFIAAAIDPKAPEAEQAPSEPAPEPQQ